MRRPKLLFLCQTLPFPPDGGVQIRSFNVLKQLSRAFDVTALCFYRKRTRSDERQVASGLAGLREFAMVEAFPIPHETSHARLFWDHARSVVTRRVYTRYAYDSSAFRASLRSLLGSNSFDLVHLDSLDLSAYVPMLKGIPTICTHHNVESGLLVSRADTESNPAFARYLRHQATLMEAEERRWCDGFDLNVTVSEDDARRLREIVPGAQTLVVPNGVDTMTFQPDGSTTGGLVFVGGFGWYPNRDGMKYFADEILPLLRRRRTDLRVTWVGRAPDPVREEYQTKHGVSLTGYVDDIRPYVHGAACYIVPLRAGGGTRLKILDAWAMGKAVVSTSIGCEGLDARDGSNILIRDEPSAFADAVARVLDEPVLRETLGRNARETAERIYDWDVIGTNMVEAYLSTLEPSRV